MRLLLDTQALILAATRTAGLPGRAAELLRDAGNRVDVSIVSLWEITIKVSIGKLSFPMPAHDTAVRLGFTLLPIELAHLVRLADLPMHHRDPFDRMLAAQALAEGVPIVTGDPRIGAYGPQVVWG